MAGSVGEDGAQRPFVFGFPLLLGGVFIYLPGFAQGDFCFFLAFLKDLLEICFSRCLKQSLVYTFLSLFWKRQSKLTNIFGRASNHQLVYFCLLKASFDLRPYYLRHLWILLHICLRLLEGKSFFKSLIGVFMCPRCLKRSSLFVPFQSFFI